MAGYIEVPDAQIKEPVYPGPATPNNSIEVLVLQKVMKSLNQQNISIAGHTFTDRSHYQFTNLKSAKIGSKVYFKTGNQTRKYKITKIRDVKPTEVKVLDEHPNKKNQLTLITCIIYNEETGVWETRKIFIATQIN